jgi:hypothetical protein
VRYQSQKDEEVVVGADTMQHQEQLACSSRLLALAADIRNEHEATAAALKRGLEHALRAGELLIEAKALLKHGQWLPWLRDHCAISDRTARLYTSLARNRAHIEAQIGSVADLSVRGAVALMATPKTSDYAKTAATIAAEAAVYELDFAELDNRVREREKRSAVAKEFGLAMERIISLAEKNPLVAAVAESVWDQDLLGERAMAAIANYKGSLLAGDYVTATAAVLEGRDVAWEMLRRVEVQA